MEMRGSIPRRQKVRDVPKRERRPRPMVGYAAPGPVLVPAEGSTRILEHRFPAAGMLSRITLQLPDLPDKAKLRAEVWYGPSRVGDVEIKDKMTRCMPLLVDGETIVTVRLAQDAADHPVTVTPNVSYVFQEPPNEAFLPQEPRW